jgi:hypothetical protein
MNTDEAAHRKFLRRADAARYIRDKWGLPCAPRTLAKLACISSEGPIFRLAGRFPLYDPKDLDDGAHSRHRSIASCTRIQSLR